MPALSERAGGGQRRGHLVRRQQFFALTPGECGGNLNRSTPPGEHLAVFFKETQQPLACRLIDKEGEEGGSIPEPHRSVSRSSRRASARRALRGRALGS